MSSLCGLAMVKCPAWHLTAGLGSWCCPEEPCWHLAGAEYLFYWDSLCAWLCLEVLEMGAREKRCSTCWIQSLSLASSPCPQMCGCAGTIRVHFHDLGTFLPWITSPATAPLAARGPWGALICWQRPWKAAWIWDGTRALSLLFPCKMLLALGEHHPPPPPVLFQLRMGLCPF